MQNRSRSIRAIIAATAVIGALILAGCTATAGAAPDSADTKPSASTSARPTPSTSTSAPEPTAGRTTDTETCAAISDVITIEQNVWGAVRDGRMEAQERDGWYRLATRDFQRIPTQSTSPVSQKVAEIQATIPKTNPGAYTEPVVGTDEWKAASAELVLLCRTAGTEVIVQGFTGG